MLSVLLFALIVWPLLICLRTAGLCTGCMPNISSVCVYYNAGVLLLVCFAQKWKQGPNTTYTSMPPVRRISWVVPDAYLKLLSA